MIEWLIIGLVLVFVSLLLVLHFCVYCKHCGCWYMRWNEFTRIGREQKPTHQTYLRAANNTARLHSKYPTLIGSQCPRCQAINEWESWIDESRWELCETETPIEIRDCPMCDAKGTHRVHVPVGAFESDSCRNTTGSVKCGFCKGKTWVPIDKLKTLMIV